MKQGTYRKRNPVPIPFLVRRAAVDGRRLLIRTAAIQLIAECPETPEECVLLVAGREITVGSSFEDTIEQLLGGEDE